MANIDSITLNANRFMQAFGQGVNLDGSIALAVTPPLNDDIRVMLIPSGTKVSGIILGNSDMDTNGSPTLAFSLGYQPVVSGDGPVASLAYFGASGDTALQSANLGKVYRNFAAITFDKDVYLVLRVTAAAATFAAGTIHATVIGEARGTV
jgi:hypothetical protein